LLTQDVELILAITFGKDQGLARRKREKERVTPEFGERKEEKILPQIQGVTVRLCSTGLSAMRIALSLSHRSGTLLRL
jgi:hypothetical protein